MGFAEGVVWSLLGAVAHTAIDVLRKCGAQRLPPADLIALLTLYNAAFAVTGAWLIDGALPRVEDIPNLDLFIKAVFGTAALSLTAAVLYQRALSIAPLSLTVPYLAFAPVFVVFVSPLFLVGEMPSAMGLMGVAVVSVAGYKLGVLGAADAAALSQQVNKPAKAKAPLLPVGSKGAVIGNGTASSKMLFDDPLRQEEQLIPAADVRGRAREGAVYAEQQPLLQSQQQQPQQHSRVYQRQPAQLPLKASSHELHLSVSSEQGGHSQQPAGQQQHSPEQAEAQHALQDEQQQQQQGVSSGGSDVRGSSGGMKQKSAWAIAYYKQKSPPVGVWEAACGGLQSAAQQLLATTALRSPHNGGSVGAHSSYLAAGSPNGHLASSSSNSSSNGSSAVWGDSQAKAGKALKHHEAKRGAHGALSAAQRSSSSNSTRARRLPRWLRGPLLRLQQLVRGPVQVLSGPTAGPTLVLIVAFLYSVNASMDKLGMSSSSSTAFYLMVQRLLIASVSLLYLLLSSPRTLRHLYTDATLLFSMSLVEQAAIVLYFKAIQNMLVSYMVAIKRINVLLSTLVGCVMFKERVGRRMPYILLMLLGMLLIVLQPGHEALHHSHHTRH